MLSYMIVVNDNGELKSIDQTEFENAANQRGSFISVAAETIMDVVVNDILDRRSAKEHNEPISSELWHAHDDNIDALVDHIKEARDMTNGQ